METPRCRYRPVLTWQLASMILMLVCAIPSFGHTVVFGPKTFTTEQTSTERFDLTSPCDRQANAVYTLVITNGDAAGNRRASSARVVLNGSEVAGPNDFSQQVGAIERNVVPAASNTLDVSINGPKDATLSISLRRHIDLRSDVFAEKKYFPSKDVYRDTFTASNLGDTFSVVVRSEGGASGKVVLNGTVINDADQAVTLRASNELLVTVDSKSPSSSYLAVAVIRHATDTDAPSITLTGLSDGQIVMVPQLAVAGTVTDASGVAALTINGTAAVIGANGSFNTTLTLVEGTNTIALDAADCEANVTHQTLKVVYQSAPTLVVTTPANNSATNQLTVPLSGTVSSESGIASVTANGQPMVISGTSWSGSLTFAGDGAQTITVMATDRLDRTTTVTLNVIVDQTGPEVVMTMPTPGVTTMYVANAPVGGGIRDALSGFAGVSCNGAPATVDADGIFNCTITLQLGANTITLIGRDKAGNSTTVTRSINFSPDTIKPIITATVFPPPNAAGWINTLPTVRFNCSDDRVTPRCTGPIDALQDGAGQIFSGIAADFAGNESTVSVTLNIDSQQPVINVPLPDNTIITRGTAHIAGSATDQTSGVQSVLCNGLPAALTPGGFDCSVVLTAAGWQSVAVTATDLAGNQRTNRVPVRVDKQAPRLEITAPVGSIVTADRTLEIEGTVSDDDQIASLTIGGAPAAIFEGGFVTTVPLNDGDNNIVVVATDRAGNTSSVTVSARSFVRPAIRITQPADFAVTSNSTITVSGTISGSVAAVDVNGIAATISGTTFSAANVPLQQGRTVITATVRGTNGQLATDDLNIYRDSIPPRVSVYSPANNDTVTAAAINVGGMVDDIVIGTVNAGQVTVKVNNISAVVSNRAFLASNITLKAGANTLTVVATDRAGNITTVTQNVTYNAAGARIIAVSGNGQSAAIGAALAQPLKIRLLDAAGAAAPNKSVTFTIAQNDGQLTAGTNNGRELSVTTNSLGEASVNWTLGHRAGAGNNRVRAVAAGFAGNVEFTANATSGAAAKVVVDMGNNQYGVSGETLPRPLVAVVVDSGSNRLANVPVTFSVVTGGGSIEGNQSVTVNTDSDGRALVKPRLGPGEGFDNNSFAASVAGVTQAAVFKATGRAAGPASETSISGVVVDNTNIPIAGVSIRIDQTSRSTQSDARGQFTFASAPVGYVKLIVDGSTAQRPGTWPMLEFIMYTNPGQNNTIGMPIYLLPIDVTRGIQVTETTGGTLTLPELPGFSLKVAPGSALFPSGSRAGTISATLVHSDKVPMTPGFGQQPKFIVTIQPPGVHFDPPAALTMPNVDGLAPGEVTEMYSFDHDLGQFVAIGTGAASEDGTTIASDPGVGIIKSGWHCSGNPNATGSSGCMSVTAQVVVPEQDFPATLLAGPRTATQSVKAHMPRMISHATGAAKVVVVGGCAIIQANGSPVNPNLSYSGWEFVDDPNDPDDDPTVATFTQPAGCTNTTTCNGKIRGIKDGLTTVRANYINTQTGQKAYDDVKVRFVDFKLSADELSVNGDVQITKDVAGSLSDIIDPIWKKSNAAEDNNPVMITPQDTLTLLVKFKLDTPLKAELPNVKFTGKVAGGGMGGTFKATQNVPANQQTFDVQFTGTLTGFKSQLIDPLTITFDALPPTDCPFPVSAGMANVKTYSVAKHVTFTVYLSTLHLAAAGTQVALTNQSQLQSKVWAKFGNGSGPTNPKTWRNTELVYYPPGEGFSTVAGTEDRILMDGKGRCGSFAPLMGHALALNGVEAYMIVVLPNSAALQPGTASDPTKAFLVKKWKFPPSSQTPSVTNQGAYKWIFRSIGANEMYPEPDLDFSREYGDITSEVGVPGQGTNDPQEKVHYNHAIVRIGNTGNTFMDPSYGLTYSGPADFESKALHGYINFTVPAGVTATGIASSTGQGVKFGVVPNPF